MCLVVKFLTCSLIRLCSVRLICWALPLCVTDRGGEESLESASDSSCKRQTSAATALNNRELKARTSGTKPYLPNKTNTKGCITHFVK